MIKTQEWKREETTYTVEGSKVSATLVHTNGKLDDKLWFGYTDEKGKSQKILIRLSSRHDMIEVLTKINSASEKESE